MLVSTLMIFAVLMILVLSFMGITFHEIRQSAAHENTFQAYYFARSGIDLSLEWLYQYDSFVFYNEPEYDEKVFVYASLSEDIFQVENDEQELDDLPFFVEIEGTIEKIEVEVEEGELDERIEIKMTGHFKNNQYNLELILFSGADPFTGEDPTGDDISDLLDTPKLSDSDGDYTTSDDSELEPEPWSDGNHITDTDGETYESDNNIAFQATGDEVIQLPERESNFMAPEIHFEDSFKMNSPPAGTFLRLSAAIIVFHEEVKLNGRNPNLCFSLPKDEYSTAEIGYVVFKKGVEGDHINNLEAGVYSYEKKYDDWTCVNSEGSELELVESEPIEYEYGDKYNSIWN